MYLQYQTSLGLVSHQEFVALKPFSELCPAFQIRQAAYKEILCVYYCKKTIWDQALSFSRSHF